MNREDLAVLKNERMNDAEQKKLWSIFHSNECAEIAIAGMGLYLERHFNADMSSPAARQHAAESLRAALKMIEGF